MPIDKINSSQFAELIRTAITQRDNTFEVTIGEIPDLCIEPQARVFERQHDDVRKVSLMMSLSSASEFDGEYTVDLEGIVYNEGIVRTTGTQATGTAVFSRAAAPTTDIVVQRGYPVGTAPDESTGLTLTFVTTEERTMESSSYASYYNATTQRYELSVPIVAVVEGSQGVVGAGRVNRTVRPLAGFDEVSNTTATSNGRDAETNQELIDRYSVAILGRRLATSSGVKKYILDKFPEVDDVYIAAGNDLLLTRAADDAGAVDAYITGEELQTATESPAYPGAGQLIPVDYSPVVEVTSVQDLTGPTTFTEGTDYDVVYDDTGNEHSNRAVDGVRFKFTGSAPVVGYPVTINYSYNNLVRRIQTETEQDDVEVRGRDLLVKYGEDVAIIIDANMRVESSFETSLVQKAVETAIQSFINDTLKLGDDVEESDIQGVVRQISGVDNFIFTRLTRSTVSSGVGDIVIAGNEVATLAANDLTITLI